MRKRGILFLDEMNKKSAKTFKIKIDDFKIICFNKAKPKEIIIERKRKDYLIRTNLFNTYFSDLTAYCRHHHTDKIDMYFVEGEKPEMFLLNKKEVFFYKLSE